MDLAALARPGHHQPLVAANGAVATSQPLAAAAGLRMLLAGGTAADAAIATATCLTVVEPCSNGLGSDAFALVWDGSSLTGLNGSGRTPAAVSAGALRAAGHTSMPGTGWDSVTVPGAVAAWRDLHARYGRLPFAQLLEPAIEYADGGFPVSGVVAWGWGRGVAAARRLSGDPYAGFLPTFAASGRAPRPGERVRLPDHAATLLTIAETRGEAFYTGSLAEAVVAFSQATGGALMAADLAAHTSEWVEPISVGYHEYEVHEIPPNGQGIAALAALRILAGFDLASMSAEHRAHLIVEACKLSLSDAHAYVGDPTQVDVPTETLLSDAYAETRRTEIGDRAVDPRPGVIGGSDTVYLCAADGEGQMVSFIQSNYAGFGSYVVAPGTGIALQNRGSGFSLTEGHPNELAGGRRPFHTIIPGFLTQGGQPVGPFGVMGGHMQAQGHVQVVLSTVDDGLDPQAALDRPRLHWDSGRRVQVEDASLIAPLAARGHEVSVPETPAVFGRGQIIWRTDGGYVAASDPRADGVPMGW